MKLIKQLTFKDLERKTNDVELDPRVILWGDTRWDSFLEDFKKTNIFAFDFETYGAGPNDALYFRNQIPRLLSIALSEKTVAILDFGGWKDNREERLERYGPILKILEEKLKDLSCIKLGINLKFDIICAMAHFGFKTRQVRDLMITSQVIWAGVGVEKAKAGENRAERCKISHGMKGLAERLGVLDLPEFPLDKSEQTSDWGWDLTNSQLNYSGMDSLILFPMYSRIKPYIREAKCIYSIMAENDAVPVFAEMEYYGVPVDVNEAERQLEVYKQAQLEEIKPYLESFPDSNWLSNPQVLENLNEKYPELNLTSVGAEVLATIGVPETEALIKARSMNTSINYLSTLIENSFQYKEDEFHSVRTFYRQIAPSGTGRSSCNSKIGRNSGKLDVGIQLQNPPAKPPRKDLPNIASCFAAPEGYSYAVFDLSAAHARIATQLSKAELLCKIYNEDFDGHSIFAAFIAEQAWLEKERLDKLDLPIPETLAEVCRLQEETSSNQKYWDEDNIKTFKKIHKLAKSFRDLAKTCLYSCVPLETQCLTREGWKYHNEVEVGTEILAYNPETEKNEWTPILEKFFYQKAPVEEWRVGQNKFFASTPNHRWYGKRRVRGKTSTSYTYYRNHWFTTDTVTSEDIILNVAKAESSRGIEVRDFIHKHFEDDKWVQLVLNMTESERWLFFSANIATDGHVVKNDRTGNYIKSVVFSQEYTKQPGLYEAMKLCGYLLGYGVLESQTSSKAKSGTLYTCRFNIRPTTTCQKPQFKQRQLKPQPVWCVSTKFGTWVTQYKRYATITGNSLNGSTAGRFHLAALGQGFDWFTIDIAKNCIGYFGELYPELVKFIRDNNKQVNSTDYDFSSFLTFDGKPLEGSWGQNRTLTGRIVYFKKYPCRAEWKKGQYEVSYTDNISSNWLMAEADIMKRWGADCLLGFDLHPEWDAKIVVNRHDEWNFTCKTPYVKEVASFIYSTLEKVMGTWITCIPIDEAGLDPTKCFARTAYEAK